MDENTNGQDFNKKEKKPMSKTTLVRIIAISAASVVAVLALVLGLVFGLKKDEPVKPEYTVTFKAGEHAAYSVTNFPEITESGSIKVVEDTIINFTLVYENHYEGGTVFVNSEELTAGSRGVYAYTVKGDAEINFAGVVESGVILSGTGSAESPYLISEKREYEFLAAQVNAMNAAYVLANYELANDIDFGGATIPVIGNGINNAFFAGHFDGKNHTLSNFKISTTQSNVSGLFGFVQQYVADESQAGANSGVIRNLKLTNFSLSATAPSKTNVFAGSVIGFGAAAKVINCEITEGEITVLGNNYFSYAGGAVGILQSGSISSLQEGEDGNVYDVIYPYYASVNSVHTDVDIIVAGDYVYAAGGVVGITDNDHYLSPVYITNSYSEGLIFGAMRSGGIVGILSDNGSVSNCYSTSEIESNSPVDASSGNDSADFDALAGGIAGFAGLNTAIVSCFSQAELYAQSNLGDGHAFTGDIVARTATAGVANYAATIANCHYGEQVALTTEFVRNTLGWNETDWSFTNGKLPVLPENIPDKLSFNLKVNYGDKKVLVDNEESSEYTLSIKDITYYLPIVEYYRFSDLDEFVYTVDEFTSCGYYFDKECTLRLPYGFVPVGNTTVYAKFVNYSPVAQTYYYNSNGRVIELKLDKKGEYTYSDGITAVSTYTYDGEKIIFNEAPFARLSGNVLEENPVNNYEKFNFAAILNGDGNGLKIYDGNYFTQNAALEMSTTNSESKANEFVGVWEKSATINKKYTFTETGWTYTDGKTTVNGTYTVTDGVATLTSSGNYGTAEIAESGLLQITVNDVSEYYSYSDGLLGTWFDRKTGNYIVFNGYNGNKEGTASVSVDGNLSILTYVRDGFFDDGGKSSVTFVSPTSGSLFGFVVYDKHEKVLTGSLYNAQTGTLEDGHSFILVDNYTGEWIGEDPVGDVKFSHLYFDGFGLYNGADIGFVEITGADGNITKVPYNADSDNLLAGSFTYNGVEYSLAYDDINGKITVSSDSGIATLYRKDELYTYVLVEGNISCTFNGGGKLISGGQLTYTNGSTSTIYTYYIKSGSVATQDLSVEIHNAAGEKVGTITIDTTRSCFALRFNDGNKANLKIRNSFFGQWAIQTSFDMSGSAGSGMQQFTIGDFNLSGKATGYFQSYEATYTVVSDTCVLVSYYDENSKRWSANIVLVDSETLAISNYQYLVAGNYYYAAHSDRLFGEWVRNNLAGSISFDGMGFSKYCNGVAYDSETKTTYYYTYRFGKYFMWDVNDTENDVVIEIAMGSGYPEDIDDYYSVGARYFTLEEFTADVTPVLTATGNGVSYEFYLDGNVLISDRSYAYELISVNGNITKLVIRDLNGSDLTVFVDSSQKTVNPA